MAAGMPPAAVLLFAEAMAAPGRDHARGPDRRTFDEITC
jgi:hypothetical protein